MDVFGKTSQNSWPKAQCSQLSSIKTLVGCSRQFQQAVILFRRKIIIEKINGIDLISIFYYFIVTMRTGAFARAANITDHFSAFDSLSTSCFYFEHMAI